jgi:hypothetical protein
MPSPRNNKNKTQDPSGAAKSKKSIQKKEPRAGSHDKPAEAPQPIPPWKDGINGPLPYINDELIEPDEETVLYFLSHYQALERALMRAGYTRAGHTSGSVQPDWPRFARHIQPRFEKDTEPVIQGAVAYMLLDEDHLALREERIENAHPWESPDPHNDTVWLAELLQQTRKRLIHWLNFPGAPAMDMAMVSAALFIVDAWSILDPQVEKLLGKGV